jgi:hypothetical protein
MMNPVELEKYVKSCEGRLGTSAQGLTDEIVLMLAAQRNVALRRAFIAEAVAERAVGDRQRALDSLADAQGIPQIGVRDGKAGVDTEL